MRVGGVNGTEWRGEEEMRCSASSVPTKGGGEDGNRGVWGLSVGESKGRGGGWGWD